MTRTTRILVIALALAAFASSAATAVDLGGTIKLGGVVKDEEGDRSTTPETFGFEEGFTLSQVDLDGSLGRRSFFHLDMRDITLRNGRARFDLRMADAGRLWFRYNRHRQVYDAAGSVHSDRFDYRGGLTLTPTRWLDVTGNYGYQERDGDRLSHPERTASFLGAGYDYQLNTARVEADLHRDGRHAVFAYDHTKFSDAQSALHDRQGRLFSVRFSGTDFHFGDVLSHQLNVDVGEQELQTAGTKTMLTALQYLGTVRPRRDFQFRYRLYLGRTDDEASHLETDLVRNDFDLTWYGKAGQLHGGYGYVTNDDRHLTSYHAWRLGGKVHWDRRVRLKADYASSEKTEDAARTLLRDSEAHRLRVGLEGDPTDYATVGVGFQEREREFPLLDVEASGRRWHAFGRLHEAGHGGLYVDYAFSDDEYTDLDGGFQATNHSVTARLDLEYFDDLYLATGLTWLDVGQDLDIEKSILMFEGRYDLLEDYFVEVKYNVYNYDDYVLVDRYYTANVVWFNVGYRLAVN
ncbi:MAG: porin [bacterium]|nr:porin [bacterium]